jgi:hypothetical protein
VKCTCTRWEAQELLVAMPGLAAEGHGAGGDVERREQRGGALADVVMGAPLREPGLHVIVSRLRGPHRRTRVHLVSSP